MKTCLRSTGTGTMKCKIDFIVSIQWVTIVTGQHMQIPDSYLTFCGKTGHILKPQSVLGLYFVKSKQNKYSFLPLQKKVIT